MDGLGGRRVVVIGGGLCGAVLAMRLLASGAVGFCVTLVEQGERIGRGVAYGTGDPLHLLDVPACRMGLDPDDADDFVRFARARGVPAGPGSLLPRALFGDYVERALELAEGAGPGALRRVRARAVAVRGEPGAREVILDDGAVLPADDVVLALGHGSARIPEALRAVRDDPRVHREPFAVPPFDREDRVLIVGTGPTAIDVLLGLAARRHEGRTLAVSRSGMWPHPHLPDVVWEGGPIDAPPAREPTADGLAEWIRTALALADDEGAPWQAMVDVVAARMPGAWAALPIAERARFLEAHGRWWDRLRQRAPLAALEALESLREDLVLVDRAAEITRVRAFRSGLVVWLRLTGRDVPFRSGLEECWTFERVVLCTGAETDWNARDEPLVRDLVGRGEVRPDALRLGVETDPLGRPVGLDGRVRPDLWVLGAARGAAPWEAASVADLARQARDLARSLAAPATVKGDAALPAAAR